MYAAEHILGVLTTTVMLSIIFFLLLLNNYIFIINIIIVYIKNCTMQSDSVKNLII